MQITSKQRRRLQQTVGLGGTAARARHPCSTCSVARRGHPSAPPLSRPGCDRIRNCRGLALPLHHGAKHGRTNDTQQEQSKREKRRNTQCCRGHASGKGVNSAGEGDDVPKLVLPASSAARLRNLSGIWSRHDSFRCRSTASWYLDANSTSLGESLENSSSLPKMWKTNFSIFHSRIRRYDASRYLTRSISIWYREIPNASPSSGCSLASSTCACCWFTHDVVHARRDSRGRWCIAAQRGRPGPV